MAMSISILAVVAALHLIAFVLAIGAEERRSTSKVVPDQYDERTYCLYDSDASTAYGLTAFGLLLLSQALVNGVTRCYCCGRGLMNGSFKAVALFFFVISWLGFLGAEACLLAGSARNAYHTKYRGWYMGEAHLSCATLRKGVFGAAAALSLVSMVGSIIYYWAHSRADTGGWQKHRNEGVDMPAHEPEQQRKDFQNQKV